MRTIFAPIIVPFSFVVLTFAYSSTMLAGPSLKYKTNLQQIFGDEKGDVLSTAGQLAAIQLAKDSVWECARTNAWRGIPKQSGVTWMREAWFDAKKDMKIPSYVNRLELRTAAGTGTLRTLLPTGNSQISIKINPDIIPAKDTDEEMNFLLDVVVHEIGHNIGLTHGTGTDYDDDYRGYYVEALGICARSDGKFPGWPTEGLSLNGQFLTK